MTATESRAAHEDTLIGWVPRQYQCLIVDV